ncbi:hypothetical protein D4L85_02085 [Chryseolinea soli]|uniref:Uncharacterized protein n=1 Tax=Chryseolinea soli TaxID=2321403 RepID=A0A385SCS8_9BACT|nr:hypothetical protein D4L85_02085 [Chryseolinea soli]
MVFLFFSLLCFQLVDFLLLYLAAGLSVMIVCCFVVLLFDLLVGEILNNRGKSILGGGMIEGW